MCGPLVVERFQANFADLCHRQQSKPPRNPVQRPSGHCWRERSPLQFVFMNARVGPPSPPSAERQGAGVVSPRAEELGVGVGESQGAGVGPLLAEGQGARVRPLADLSRALRVFLQSLFQLVSVDEQGHGPELLERSRRLPARGSHQLQGAQVLESLEIKTKFLCQGRILSARAAMPIFRGAEPV